ncbi:protection of telomeres protein 1 isoform X2 [Sphaerodactylus townsendi]|uniref:protection of telomeres protein 1 isoform X2 n=1 Tax=Sphaerodactylus townsendi TaxID=933632 RepID=UPI002027357A|nr:protection of telomeres protein 1 isoform X2 [Sphaerodactylus townsendi]
MPIEVLKVSLRGLKNALPKHLQKVDLKDLRLGGDYTDKYFQGAVVISYPLTKLGNGKAFFKTVLQESENSCSRIGTINILLFGKLAEDCEKVIHQGDTMVVAGFSLSKSASEDGRHCLQLKMPDEAGSSIYICPKSRRTAVASETVAMSVAPKYTYTPLNHLKGGTVVNLYGVVKFFKPPYVSKGTDYCSVVTIVDQSDTKLVCTLFNANTDALPKIYKNGDIVRFHRLKVQEFNGQMQGITNNGFAALTFDGTVGAPVVPRTTTKLFTFTDEDKKIVEDLRIWAARNFSNSVPAANLSSIQPQMFFDFTCQLVGKAKTDGSSYLLKVWDGTKCPFPSVKVCVKEDDLEGDRVLINQLKNLTVDVIVYDNHVQMAESLKVGSFIRMYSLHAKTQRLEEKSEVSYIQFHLHGGTGYGRGITVLPENHRDVKELKAFLESVDLREYASSESPTCQEPEDSYLTLGSCSEGYQQLSVTVLTDHQHFDVTTVNTILNSRVPQQYRIRAKLRKFEPKKLYQSVKLLCPQCNSLKEVPDVTEFDVLLQASATYPNPDLQNIPFCESVVWDLENQGSRYVTVHFVTRYELLQEPEDSLIMIEGGTVNEILRLSKKFKGIIPVKSIEENLVLLDLSVPFFWQGNIQYYGCQHCSDPKTVPSLYTLSQQKNASWEPTAIAEALGIVLLQYVFVMTFTLDDGTGALDAYLVDTGIFFQIPASEILTCNIFQENMERIMNKLQPPEANPELSMGH